MTEQRGAIPALVASTLAFTVCFAAWMLNGVLVTYLVDNRVYPWDASQMGVLIGAPVLTGSILRLPLGMLTDRYGGRPVFTGLLTLCAIPMLLLSYADSFGAYLAASLAFGAVGSGFAVGIAFTSVWFSKERQGTVLGIFGTGNAGSAITTLAAPALLRRLGAGGDPDAWRMLPRLYAGALLATAVLFYLSTKNRLPAGATRKTVGELFAPLRKVRVWRFGLYYFLVFGGFVALAQWLVPYYVSVYSMSIVTAGLMTSIFSLPSGVIRALGGWASDKWGPRRTLVAMLFIIATCCALLFFPKMDIESPGRGVMAARAGTVTEVTDRAVVLDGEGRYALLPQPATDEGSHDRENHILPIVRTWQEPVVKVGDKVVKKQLVARGITHIYFQANVWVFTVLVFVVGIAMGVGKAAVYKYIPEYFPEHVGVVGGLVGVIGGLGGFVSPIIFGTMLDAVGLWTTTWMFLFAVAIVCIVWLNLAIRGLPDRHEVST